MTATLEYIKHTGLAWIGVVVCLVAVIKIRNYHLRKYGIDLLADPPRGYPHYTSTACMHAHHELCRLECKYCHVRCRCACHDGGVQQVGVQQVGPSAV